MKHFTFEEYKQALEGVSPDAMECILSRAAEDPGIDLDSYCTLVDLVEMMEGVA